jgi:hypothetical protein
VKRKKKKRRSINRERKGEEKRRETMHAHLAHQHHALGADSVRWTVVNFEQPRLPTAPGVYCQDAVHPVLCAADEARENRKSSDRKGLLIGGR